jgi:DNA-directed RNA polymerase subunit RPC12/RpoP
MIHLSYCHQCQTVYALRIDAATEIYCPSCEERTMHRPLPGLQEQEP